MFSNRIFILIRQSNKKCLVFRYHSGASSKLDAEDVEVYKEAMYYGKQFFGANTIVPLIEDLRVVMKQASEKLGSGGLYNSESVGGRALSSFRAALVIEGIAQANTLAASNISKHSISSWLIEQCIIDPLKRRLLPKLIACDKLATVCNTEPGILKQNSYIRLQDPIPDSANRTKTTATIEFDECHLNGTKCFVSADKDVYVVTASDGGVGAYNNSCYVVEREAEGLQIHKEGIPSAHAGKTVQLELRDVCLPLSHRICGRWPNRKTLVTAHAMSRLNLAAVAIGGTHSVLSDVLQASKNHPIDQRHLEQLTDELTSARMLTLTAAKKLDQTHYNADVIALTALARERAHLSCLHILKEVINMQLPSDEIKKLKQNYLFLFNDKESIETIGVTKAVVERSLQLAKAVNEEQHIDFIPS